MNKLQNMNTKLLQSAAHLVTPSPWPFITSAATFAVATDLTGYFHLYPMSPINSFYVSFSMLTYCIIRWFTDIVMESTFMGHHTLKVQSGLRYGMLLFIVSEVMFFFAFFWAFLHSSLATTPEIACLWPPRGIEVINPWSLPLYNTILLVSSGIVLTYAHRGFISKEHSVVQYGLSRTIIMGLFFTALQLCEYIDSQFSINDSIYGSNFFMATGFHGFHVIMGTVILVGAFLRNTFYHFSDNHHFGFEAGAWYWHFVDVVWILLFIVVYWLGGNF